MQINMMTPDHKQYVQLPASLKAIKDIRLQYHPGGCTALLACTGNSLAVASSAGFLQQISLSAPCHSCAWAPNSPAEVYAGEAALTLCWVDAPELF